MRLRTPSRRKSLLLAGVTATALLATGSPPLGASAPAVAASAANVRPNVVFILVDDATVDDVTDPRVMPNVARWLIGEGTSFSTSYAPFPLCCPARATLLTGQYAHNHGVLDNKQPWGGTGAFSDTDTLPVWLQGAGYSTAFIGKYMNGYGTTPTYVPPGWTTWKASTTGTYNYWRTTYSMDGVEREIAGRYQTKVLSTHARLIVERRAPAEQPFFLFASYVAPHGGAPHDPDDWKHRDSLRQSPLVHPLYRDLFADNPVPSSAAFNEQDVSDKPAAIQARPPLSAAEVSAVTEVYQQRQEALRSVDDGVGRVMQALADSGELANTYVILTSDNGYLLGEHRIRQGKVLPYEPSARVPLIIRGPGVPAGEVRTQPVAAIDVAPTVVGVAGAEPYLNGAIMDGQSLLPKVADPTRAADRDLVLEAGPAGSMQDYRYHGLRTADGWKYVEYHTGERELYNLAVDPEELDNLAEDPGSAAMQTYLAERLRQLEYCAGSGCS